MLAKSQTGEVRREIGRRKRAVTRRLENLRAAPGMPEGTQNGDAFWKGLKDDLFQDHYVRLVDTRDDLQAALRKLQASDEQFREMRSSSPLAEQDYAAYIATYGDYTKEIAAAQDAMTRATSVLAIADTQAKLRSEEFIWLLKHEDDQSTQTSLRSACNAAPHVTPLLVTPSQPSYITQTPLTQTPFEIANLISKGVCNS